ncbi:acyl carrier protein [Actinopolyspora mortivallis]|uniref:Carrier domain-containing protein n=1 Tax=Actinopolyspora mortivallis TaxID=33906 RepID=A0A2T0GYL6_ACTMO|nr:acyl carrier protein [Actinopolyspora mortivallis]PRW64212.1 hypothetical protein CEP50_06125 [Actinopolyspora mortivallis]
MTPASTFEERRTVPDLETLRAADIDERIRRIVEFVCKEMRITLEIPPEEDVDPTQPLHTLGVGSITALRLKRRFELDLLVEMDLVRILRAESVSELSARLALCVEDAPMTASSGTAGTVRDECAE